MSVRSRTVSNEFHELPPNPKFFALNRLLTNGIGDAQKSSSNVTDALLTDYQRLFSEIAIGSLRSNHTSHIFNMLIEHDGMRALPSKKFRIHSCITLNILIPFELLSFKKNPILFFICLDKPVELIEPLEDRSVQENENATLVCQLSKPDMDVIWYHNDRRIFFTRHSRIRAKQIDCYYKLLLDDIEYEDQGLYEMSCEHIKTSCHLIVKKLETTFLDHLTNLTVREGV